MSDQIVSLSVASISGGDHSGLLTCGGGHHDCGTNTQSVTDVITQLYFQPVITATVVHEQTISRGIRLDQVDPSVTVDVNRSRGQKVLLDRESGQWLFLKIARPGIVIQNIFRVGRCYEIYESVVIDICRLCLKGSLF